MKTMKDANDAKKTLSDRLSVTKQLIENDMTSTARHRSLQTDAVRLEAATQILKKLQDWKFFLWLCFCFVWISHCID